MEQPASRLKRRRQLGGRHAFAQGFDISRGQRSVQYVVPMHDGPDIPEANFAPLRRDQEDRDHLLLMESTQQAGQTTGRSHEASLHNERTGFHYVTLSAPKQPVAPPAPWPRAVDASRRRRYFCMQRQRVHVGPCARHNGTCFRCQLSDHWKIDCHFNKSRRGSDSSPRRNNQARQHGDQTELDITQVHSTENRKLLVHQLDSSG